MRAADVLALPALYDAFGLLVGVSRVRTVLAREYVRPRSGDRVLDLGCGPGSMFPYLAGVDYTGVDANARYIAAAQAKYPAARFICDRIGDHVVAGERFDLVVAAGVLHHLGDAEAAQLIRVAHARLRSAGRLITLDPCVVEPQHPVARWLARHDRGVFVRSPEDQLRLVRGVFPGATASLRHDLLRVAYTHLIVECTRD